MRRTKLPVKSRQINVLLYPEEYSILETELSRSTFHYMSELVRAKVLKKPVVIRYRSESAEKFLELALDIKHNLLLLIESSPTLKDAEINTEVSRIVQTMDLIYKELLKKSPTNR